MKFAVKIGSNVMDYEFFYWGLRWKQSVIERLVWFLIVNPLVDLKLSRPRSFILIQYSELVSAVSTRQKKR